MKRRNQCRKPEPKPGDHESEIMTLQDVADYLKLHYITVYRFIKTRGLPAFRLGSDWRFRRSDLEKWIGQRSVLPEEPKTDEPSRRGRHKRKF